jgi:hypothetical protein
MGETQMTKTEKILIEQARLTNAYDAARASGDKAAAVEASRVLNEFIMSHNPPKRWGRYRVTPQGKHVGIKAP